MVDALTEVREESLGNVVLMEHLNMCVGDQLTATQFYIVGMGFTRDPFNAVGLTNIHVNVGQQQFHLPTQPTGVQVVPGHVGVVVPSIDALRNRLKSVEDSLKDTEFGFSDADGYFGVTCPWGNQFRVYEPAPRFGTMTLGLPYIQFDTRPGTAAGIARFYQGVMGAPSTVEGRGPNASAHIRVGRSQTLIFQEIASDLPAYSGYHIAVYVSDFAGPYEFCDGHGLLTEGLRGHQFRFQQLLDPQTGEPVFTLEHEVRNLFHPNFGVPLINRNLAP